MNEGNEEPSDPHEAKPVLDLRFFQSMNDIAKSNRRGNRSCNLCCVSWCLLNRRGGLFGFTQVRPHKVQSRIPVCVSIAPHLH